MCNLYSQTKPQDAMRGLFAPLEVIDLAGNLPVQAEVYPDYSAPILRQAGAGLVLQRARWGLPTPPQFLAGKKTDRGVTNLRNTDSLHWRRWLGPAHRCLVPFDQFAEPQDGTQPRRTAWFKMADDRPAFFAGVCVPGWTSVRRVKEGETTDDLFGFLTTTPNAEVAAAHPKAMPVILRAPAEWQAWLTAPWAEMRGLQRPLADGSLLRVGPLV